MADDNSSSARVLPKKKDFSWVGGGYQVTSPRGVAGIAQKYGGANPYGNPAGVAQAEWLQAPPVDNPNLSVPPVAPNPAFTSASASASPLTQTIPSGNPDGPQPVVNPNTGFPIAPTSGERAEDERQRWLAEGGSDATLHRAQVASGMRPAIDARGNAAAANSTAGAEIRQGWGWEPAVTAGSQGTAIAAQMTRDFTAPDTRSGRQQADWKQKFTDARARLRQSLES